VLKNTERPPEEVACHTKSVAPSPVAHPTKAYLPECVVEGYCELRLNGVLRSSLPASRPRKRAKISLICTSERSLICAMHASLSIVTLNTSAPVEGVQAKKKEETHEPRRCGAEGSRSTS
jgi:hypothetical protein